MRLTKLTGDIVRLTTNKVESGQRSSPNLFHNYNTNLSFSDKLVEELKVILDSIQGLQTDGLLLHLQ